MHQLYYRYNIIYTIFILETDIFFIGFLYYYDYFTRVSHDKNKNLLDTIIVAIHQHLL